MSEIPHATPGAVAIIETPDSFIAEGRPDIPGQLAHSGQIGLFGGHVEPDQTPYDTIRAELDQELDLHVMGPLQLIESSDVDSQNRRGEQVKRHVSLFHVSLDSTADLTMNVPGEIVHIPKTPEGIESHKDRLTPFAYQALRKAITSESA
jgi:8-oxo-dGTP pyrophosphatase MutT (NUDIX family)